MINRSQIGAWRIGEFMASGRRCYEPILVALTRYSALPVEQLRILDFGAGAATYPSILPKRVSHVGDIRLRH